MAPRRRALIVAAAATLACGTAQAMEFRLIGSTLIMSGAVVSDDLARLRDQLATEAVRLVVLHESPGGDLWNGLRLGERLRDEGLPVTVSGKCESACGLVFLGGVRRSFSDGRPLARTMVGLHGAHNSETKLAIPQMGAQMSYFMRRMTGDMYPSELADRTVYPKDARNFIYFFHPKRFKASATPKGVMACEIQADAKFSCTMLAEGDALSYGVITEPDVLQLDTEVREALKEP